MLARDPYRHYRRSMRRNRRMRHGGYPLIIPYPTSLPLPWRSPHWPGSPHRHRSAFWPFFITGAAFGAAALIHAHHPGYWVIAAVVTAAAGMFLGIRTASCGPARPGKARLGG